MSTSTCLYRALVLVAAMLALAVPARADRLEPKDTAASAPGYAAFRKQVLEAVARRDARFVESILAPDIAFSFGGQSGKAQFCKAFLPRDPRAEFWGDFEKIMRLAGAYDAATKTVWQPYFFHTWPDKLDAFTHAVATGRAVPVRKSPGASSPVVATLDYEIVEMLEFKPWVKVKTASGIVGYVQQGLLHCPAWRRAAFKQVKGRWLMTVYVTGD